MAASLISNALSLPIVHAVNKISDALHIGSVSLHSCEDRIAAELHDTFLDMGADFVHGWGDDRSSGPMETFLGLFKKGDEDIDVPDTNISERDVRRAQKRAGVMAWKAMEAGYKGGQQGAVAGGLLGALFGSGNIFSAFTGASLGATSYGCYDAFKAAQAAYSMDDAELDKAAIEAQDAAFKLAIQEFSTLIKNDPETAWAQVDPIIDKKLDSIFAKKGWDLNSVPGQSCLRYIAKKFTHFLVEQVFVKKYAQEGTMPYMRSQMYRMGIYGAAKSKSLLSAVGSIWTGSRKIAGDIYESMERSLLGSLEDQSIISDDMTAFDKKYSLLTDDRALQREFYKSRQLKNRIEALDHIIKQADRELDLVKVAIQQAQSPEERNALMGRRDDLAKTITEAEESIAICEERLARTKDTITLERGKITIAERTQSVVSFADIVETKRETAMRKSDMRSLALEIGKLSDYVQAQKQLISDYKVAAKGNDPEALSELGKKIMEETTHSFKTETEAIAHLETITGQVESDIAHLVEEFQEVAEKAVEAQDAEDEAYRVFKEKETLVVKSVIKECTKLAEGPKNQAEKMAQLAFLLNKDLISRDDYEEAIAVIEKAIGNMSDADQKLQFEHIAKTFTYDNIFPANNKRHNTFEVETDDSITITIENFDAREIEGQDAKDLAKDPKIQPFIKSWSEETPASTQSVDGSDRSYTVDSNFLSGLRSGAMSIEVNIPKNAVLDYRDPMGMDTLTDEELLTEQIAFACHGNAPMVTKLTQLLTPDTAQRLLAPLRERIESMQLVSESGTELHLKDKANPKIVFKVSQTAEGTLVTATANWEIEKHTNGDKERITQGKKPSSLEVGLSMVITPNIIEEAPPPSGRWYNPLSWFAGTKDPIIGPPDCEFRACWEQRSIYDTLSSDLPK